MNQLTPVSSNKNLRTIGVKNSSPYKGSTKTPGYDKYLKTEDNQLTRSKSILI
jgi:hypothetical protein